MKLITAISAIALAALCTSCMTDKEWALRKEDLKAKQQWPATYVPVSIKGPLNIPEGGELVVTVPNLPYNHAPIPDGQAIQASLARDVLHTGALLGGAIYSIKKANTGGKTVVQQAEPAAQGGAQ